MYLLLVSTFLETQCAAKIFCRAVWSWCAATLDISFSDLPRPYDAEIELGGLYPIDQNSFIVQLFFLEIIRNLIEPAYYFK